MAAPRVFLIDTFGFIFRAHHARARSGAPPMRTAAGLPTEALFIFTNMLRKLSRTHTPSYMAAIFESEGKTHREEAFPDYKANRAETPPDLLQQIPYVRRILEAARIPVINYPGFEADDVIGTLCAKGAAAGCEIVIVSSDKDMLQLVNNHVSMLNPAKDDTWYDPAKVKEFMGVEPHQVADLLALKGDAVDNIPGAPGIGEKGAVDLIAQFGSVEAALDRTSEIARKMYRESLENNRERVVLSKHLATIDCAVPVPFELEALRVHEPDLDQLRPLLKELEFFSQLKELGPTEDTRPKDLGPFLDAADVQNFLEGANSIAVCISLPLDEIGLSREAGQGRSLPFSRLAELKPWLEDATRPKVAADIKSTLVELLRRGIQPAGFTEDPSLFAFLLDADSGGCSLDALVERRLELRPGPRADERALFVRELNERLRPEVERRNLMPLFREMDLPLAPVLASMERAGIRVDERELNRLSALMDTEIRSLTTDIHALAGHEFNISSPQQLSRILFEEMGIVPPGRPAKGKAVSTAADTLEALAGEHPIAGKVLEYRQLTKLKGTYVDALPQLLDPDTARLHTTFNQCGAATGRLSSNNPNLQNIPVRTALGREIRAAFVPRDGWQLVVADYSQIELRILAHMSEDPVLIDAFRSGEDIHTRTAAEVLGIPPMFVTKEARNSAKAVNFGIVYGISSFGLAANLGISRKEADTYIKNYFERYAGVKRFIEATTARTRETGVATTLFGRERPIPDMNSRNPAARGFAERTAVNSPIQGTAADLIKVAMIRIDAALKGWQSTMLLQVHDELVLEAPPEEVDALRVLLKTEMESVRELLVPLTVETGSGPNWRDAK